MAFQKYTVSNPLHPDVFPGKCYPLLFLFLFFESYFSEIRKMEAEVVAMCLTM